MADNTANDHDEAMNAADAAHAPVAHEAPAHSGVSLGPVDWEAWFAGALGVFCGLVVILAFYLAGRT